MYLDHTMMLDIARQDIADRIQGSQRRAQRRQARAIHNPGDSVPRGRRIRPWLLLATRQPE